MAILIRLAGKAAIFVLGVVVTTIITAELTGQPLSGLAKFQGLYQTLAARSVPSWAFALALLVASLSVGYLTKGFLNRPRQGKIHFSTDVYNTYWSRRTDDEIQVSISGTFTYQGPPGGLIILKAFLNGTSAIDFDVNQTMMGSSSPIPSKQLYLQGDNPQSAIVYLRLRTSTKKFSQTLRETVVFIDKFNRKFPVGPIELPQRGK
jgi:hypothetical protein